MTITVLVLLSCAVALAIWFVISWRRTRYSLLQYSFFLFHLFMYHMVWRTRTNRELPVAIGQGAVIVANHRSSIDPSFVHGASPRVVHWMIAKEFWKGPMGAFFRLAECIPVGRSGVDTAATKLAIRYAQEGELVGMFPEGRINETDNLLLPGRPGAALIALRARVPVIPCYIEGAPYDGTATGVFFMPAKVRVTVGDPIDLSDYYEREKEDGVLEEITLMMMREIARLAGQPDFEPTLAGRRWKPEEAAG